MGRVFNPLNSELNPICHLLVLLVAHHILHVSRIRAKYRRWWLRRIACMNKTRNLYKLQLVWHRWWDFLGDFNLNDRIILKLIRWWGTMNITSMFRNNRKFLHQSANWRKLCKWSGMRWSEVKCSIGGEQFFMEKVYRSSKWWEGLGWKCEWINDCKKNNYKKLYTVLSCLGVCTFCTCCKILICLVCFVASFKLSCV